MGRNLENYRHNHADWRMRHPDSQKQMNAKYYQDHAEELKIKRQEYRLINPEKVKAHNLLNQAIRDGRVLREPCIICGKFGHLHHPDYMNPLKGVWLCSLHHYRGHRGDIEVLEYLQSLGIDF